MSVSVGDDHHESHHESHIEEHHEEHVEEHHETQQTEEHHDVEQHADTGGTGHSDDSSFTPSEKPKVDLKGDDPPPTAPAVIALEKPTKPSVPPPAGNGMVGSNYVDLGKNKDGVMIDPLSAPDQQAAIDSMRAEIHADLDRLQKDGVDTVRVFAQPPGGYSEADPQYIDKVTLRLEIVADEAQKMEPPMRVTVDLLDSANAGGMETYKQDPWGPQLDKLTQNVVPKLQGYNNVDWSLGNEIKAPDQQVEFGNWYVEKATKLREQMTNPSQRIVAELTPGAVNHPGFPPENNAAYQTMKQIASASDVVSIHFYPPTAEQFLPDGIDHMNIRPQLDWQSVQAWQQATKDVPNAPRFEIGELSIPRDDYLQRDIQQGLAHTPEEYNAIAEGWMQRLHGMGVDKVSYWEFDKDETAGGGVDPSSWDHNDDTGALNDDGTKKEYLHVSDDQMRDLVRRWSLIRP